MGTAERYLDYSGREDRLSGGLAEFPSTRLSGASLIDMDPANMEMMAGLLPRGRYLFCPRGSHIALYDDQETYFAGLIDSLCDLPTRT